MTAVLQATQVHRAFGPTQVLRGVDLTVQAGERLAIVGPSGSGKSTLLHLLAGLDAPDWGTVVLAGTDLAATTDDQRAELRRTTVGLVFQEHHLLPAATALENTLLPALAMGTPSAALHARAKDLLTRLGLADRLHHAPHALSRGQRQRVAVARAVLLSPKLLLADEPTGALDAQHAADLMALLFDAAPDTALVVVTHAPAVAHAVHRQLRLVNGTLLPA